MNQNAREAVWRGMSGVDNMAEGVESRVWSEGSGCGVSGVRWGLKGVECTV